MKDKIFKLLQSLIRSLGLKIIKFILYLNMNMNKFVKIIAKEYEIIIKSPKYIFFLPNGLYKQYIFPLKLYTVS